MLKTDGKGIYMNNPKWCVKSVVPTKDYELILTFEYGEQKNLT